MCFRDCKDLDIASRCARDSSDIFTVHLQPQRGNCSPVSFLFWAFFFFSFLRAATRPVISPLLLMTANAIWRTSRGRSSVRPCSEGTPGRLSTQVLSPTTQQGDRTGRWFRTNLKFLFKL